MQLRKLNKILLIFIFVFCGKTGRLFGQSIVPYLDTNLKKYFLFNIKNNVFSAESFNSCKISGIEKNHVVFVLNQDKESLVITDYDKTLYKGGFNIENVFCDKKNKYYGLIRNETKFGLIDFATNKLVVGMNYKYLNYFQKHNLFFFFDEESKRILIFDPSRNRKEFFNISEEPILIGNRNLIDSNLFYYESQSQNQGILDIKQGEILFGKYQYFIQVNKINLVCKTRDSGMVKFNLASRLFSSIKGDDIFRIGKNRLVLKLNGVNKLVDESLKPVTFYSQFDNLYLIQDNFQYALKDGDKWVLTTAQGRKLDSITYDRLVNFTGMSWGYSKNTNTITSLYPKNLGRISLPGNAILDYEYPNIITGSDHEYFISDLSKGGQIVARKNYKTYFTKRNYVFIYLIEKYGLENSDGTKVTMEKFDFILPVNNNYLSVICNGRSYFIDYSGREFIR